MVLLKVGLVVETLLRAMEVAKRGKIQKLTHFLRHSAN